MEKTELFNDTELFWVILFVVFQGDGQGIGETVERGKRFTDETGGKVNDMEKQLEMCFKTLCPATTVEPLNQTAASLYSHFPDFPKCYFIIYQTSTTVTSL